MPQEDDEAAELEHTEEIGIVIFPAANQSAEVVQPSEEAFDFPAAAVTTQFATVLGVLPAAIVLVGRDEPDAVFLPQALVQRIAVVGAVADHSFWFGSRESLLDGGFDEFGFMRRSAGDAAGDRKTMAVCDRHDFTAFSSASRADSSAPFFAELKLASIKVSDRSSLPRARRSSASACNSRSACHRAATAENGDGRFDKVDSGRADRAKEHRCAKSKECRSARLAHRAKADLDHRGVVSEQAAA